MGHLYKKKTLWDPAKIENEDHVLSLSYRQLSVFTVTPSKIELQTMHSIQKVQNLENKRRWVYKKLRQESGLCDISYARYSEKRFTQICKALSKDAILVFLWGTQIWPPETNGNISLWVFLQMLEINTWLTHKDLLFNVYSEKRNVYWIF